MVRFRCCAQELHVGIEEQFAPAAKAHPAFRVDGYDKLRARLAEAGVETRPDDAIPGVRRCYVTDPWGNRIELVAASA